MRYRVLLPLIVHTEDGSYAQGEEFEKEFTEEEEAANLASGLLGVVPRKYQVTGPHAVLGVAPGGELEAPLSMAQERQLVEAGHLVRAPAPKRKTRADKEG